MWDKWWFPFDTITFFDLLDWLGCRCMWEQCRPHVSVWFAGRAQTQVEWPKQINRWIWGIVFCLPFNTLVEYKHAYKESRHSSSLVTIAAAREEGQSTAATATEARRSSTESTWSQPWTGRDHGLFHQYMFRHSQVKPARVIWVETNRNRLFSAVD